MAVVCGGVWAVVSFSVLLFGVKGLGRVEGGDYIYTEHILSFKTHAAPYIHAQKHITSVITAPSMIQTSLIHCMWMQNGIIRRKKHPNKE